MPERPPDKVVTVTWVRDSTLDARIGDHHVLMDNAPPAGQGRGPSPKALLLAALGGCTALDVVSILRKKRQDFVDVDVRVEGYTAADHPRRYERVVLTYVVRGRNLDPAAVARAVELSESKYCSVSATLKQATVIETRIELTEETPVAADD
jgi:putative redox protein